MWQSIVADKSRLMGLFLLALCFVVSPISVSATTIVYLLAFIFVIFSGEWKEKIHAIMANPAAISFLLLFLLFLLGMVYSTSTSHLMFHDLQKRHWLFITPVFIAFIQDEKWRQRMVDAFLSVMVIVLMLSYAKYFFHFSLMDVFKLRTPLPLLSNEVFQDHIIQGFEMDLAFFIFGYRLLFAEKDMSILKRIVYALIMVFMFINMLGISEGRTAYAITLMLVGYLCWARFGWKGLFSAAILGVVFIGLAFVFSANFQGRIKAVYQHYETYGKTQQLTSVGQRIEMYHIAKKMIAKRPLLGYGTGGIKTALPTVVPENERVFNPSISYVESIYLNFMLEFGLVGLVVLLIAFGMQIKASLLLPPFYKSLMHAVLISVMVGGLFNGFFASFPICHLYSIFAALCFSTFPKEIQK